MELLRKLSDVFGPPGAESEVRDVLIEYITSKMDIPHEIDNLGSLYFVKKGKVDKPVIMLDGHMDEVGLFVVGHTSDGYLQFRGAGGLDPRVLPGKSVLIGKERIPGIIGTTPPHCELRKPITQRDKTTPIEGHAIDIGANSKDEAISIAPKNTRIMFNTQFEDWGETLKGKSFDDRLGCWAIARVFTELETDCTLVASFTMGEEIGMVGARLAARRFKPDLVIELEGTAAGDMPDVANHMVCTKMGGGPVLTFEDRSTIIPRYIRKALEETADIEGIQYQYKGTVTGGTNAGIMQYENGGTKCVVIAAGCRYIHAPVSLMSKSDANNIVKLTKAFIKRIDDGDVVI